MGTSDSKTVEIDKTSFKADIEYCEAWGGRKEADNALDTLSVVFPNATFNTFSPGVTKNLVIKVGDEVVYDRVNKGDGSLHDGDTMNQLCAKIKLVVAMKWGRRKKKRYRWWTMNFQD